MKVKLDENLPHSALEALTAAGYDADTVAEEGLTGSPDPDVVRAAAAADRLLITLDRGLGDVRAYPPGNHAGVLVLRLPEQSATTARKALVELIANHDLASLAGAVTVVQRGLLRIRR